MKKLLLLSNFYPPEFGGIQNYLHNLISRLPENKVAVLTTKQTNAQYFDANYNFPIYRKSFTSPLRYLKLTSLDLYLKTIRVVKKEKVEALLAGHFYLPALTCYLINRLRKIPYYISTHGSEIAALQTAPPVQQKMARRILASANGVIATSTYLAEKLVSLGVPREKITNIRPGVDLDFFKPKNQEEARDNLVKALTKLIAKDKQITAGGIAINRGSTLANLNSYNIILSVGRLVERKGQDMVIRSLPAVLKNYPKTIYLIVGHGPYQKTLNELVKKMGIENYVVFLGAPDNTLMPDLYNSCDIFTMPSRTIKSRNDVEGFGLVYLEASACGKPIVAGQGVGVAEAVLNQKTGLVVDAENPAALAQALIKLLTNRQLAESLGKNGRERMEREFNWEGLAKRLKLLLK